MYQETASLDRESRHHILKRESDYVTLWEKILERGEKQGVILRRSRMDADMIGFLLAFIPLRRWNLRNKFREGEIKSGLTDFILRALGISKRRN